MKNLCQKNPCTAKGTYYDEIIPLANGRFLHFNIRLMLVVNPNDSFFAEKKLTKFYCRITSAFYL